MAVFNGERYLQAQLDSLLVQAFRPHQIVVSDDGSTDASLSIVSGAMQAAPDIDWIIVQNRRGRGYSNNFVNAFDLCNGDVVFPCDQDDVWLPDKIEVMLYTLALHPCIVLAIHDLEICTSDLAPIGQKKMMRAKAAKGPLESYNVGMATVVRGDFLKLCLPVPASFTYDNWINFCAHLLDAKILVPNTLALYRRHGGNAAQAEVLNSEKKINPKRILFRRGLKALSSDRNARDLISELRRIGLAEDWLSKVQADLYALGFSSLSVQSAIQRNRLRAEATRRRMTVRSAGSFQRWNLVVRYLLRACLHLIESECGFPMARFHGSLFTR